MPRKVILIWGAVFCIGIAFAAAAGFCVSELALCAADDDMHAGAESATALALLLDCLGGSQRS